MAQVELIMPKMGESITEATILKWLKSEGDTIEEEESVLEIATDKVDSDVPSPVGGTLVKILYHEGDTVEVNKAIALIEVGGVDTTSDKTTVVEPKASAPTITFVTEEEVTSTNNGEKANPVPSGARFYSPLVLNMARRENISMQELEAIPGTGKDARVTKRDMLSYIKQRSHAPVSKKAPQKQVVLKQEIIQKTEPQTPVSPPKVVPQPKAPVTIAPKTTPPKVDYSGNNVEIVEMDRMRRLIADHMVMSKSVSPHVTSFVEADVTNLVKWRERIKGKFQAREGEKITFTPIFVEAVVKAIKDFPGVNASVDGYNVILHKNINVGVATALPSGNLIVPVIHNADRMNLVGLTKTTNELVQRARNNRLKPNDVQSGTFTLTNVGTFGNLMGTPIINQPQVAILATGAIKKKPAVLETEYGDVIAIRQMMYLSLSYDHRIVDGALGGSFLRRIADYLEHFDASREV